MYHLVAAVDPGVGTSGTHQIHGFIGNLADAPGQFRFYGRQPAFLGLPAMVGRTVVLQHKGYSALTDGVITGKWNGALEQASTWALKIVVIKRTPALGRRSDQRMGLYRIRAAF